ncbi:MAG: hypothetical protein JWM21_212 [Acidobacteria bacterium]|nr:hypothetical protein [Acidobacteriota bacterium]
MQYSSASEKSDKLEFVDIAEQVSPPGTGPVRIKKLSPCHLNGRQTEVCRTDKFFNERYAAYYRTIRRERKGQHESVNC